MSNDELSVNTIRCLAADIIQKATCGHPGMPMGMAPVAHVLWTRIMNYTSANSHWWNRDRFLLSNGHGCALQYILLHLAKYKVTMDDLKSFRQLDSRTPGHPEVHWTDGVEVTTGPLGQGIANGVGLAFAQTHLAATYNKQNFALFDNYTYVFAGDGCMQEGVASEAASLAGHWRLGRLIVIYDDNKIQIDGSTNLAFTEDVGKRFEAYGWHVVNVLKGDNDYDGIEAAINEGKSVTDKPSLIIVHTTIGFGSKKQGSKGVHGEALGAEDVKHVKTVFGFDPNESFVVPQSVYDSYEAVQKKGLKLEQDWKALWSSYRESFPTEAQEISDRFDNKIPTDLASKLPKWKSTDKPDATRNTGGAVLNAIADAIPWVIGGSADLTPSNKTDLKKSHDYQHDHADGRYIRFGVREHGMAAICNGIAAYGGFIPYSATFLNFIEYCFPAVRLTALSSFQQFYIMTHDSIGLGEDGPTHQPIEALTMCRATPNLLVFRPADGNETSGSYLAAIHHQGPSVFALSRQNLPQLERSSLEVVAKGAYVVYQTNESAKLDVILVATGSEVAGALSAAKELTGLNVRVVSMPCDGLFDAQSLEYRREIIPSGVPSISIEALAVLGWERYAHAHIGMRTFGASGPLDSLMKKFGFTPPQIVESTKNILKSLDSQLKSMNLSIPALPTHLKF